MKVWVACTATNMGYEDDLIHHVGVFKTEGAAIAAANHAVDKQAEVWNYTESAKKYIKPRVMEFELGQSVWEV